MGKSKFKLYDLKRVVCIPLLYDMIYDITRLENTHTYTQIKVNKEKLKTGLGISDRRNLNIIFHNLKNSC